MNTVPVLKLKVLGHCPGKLSPNLGSFQVLWEDTGIQINGCWYKIQEKDCRVSLPYKTVKAAGNKVAHYPILILPEELGQLFKASLIECWKEYAKEKSLQWVRSPEHKKHKYKKWRANVKARRRVGPAPSTLPQGFEKLREEMKTVSNKRIWNDGPKSKST